MAANVKCGWGGSHLGTLLRFLLLALLCQSFASGRVIEKVEEDYYPLYPAGSESFLSGGGGNNDYPLIRGDEYIPHSSYYDWSRQRQQQMKRANGKVPVKMTGGSRKLDLTRFLNANNQNEKFGVDWVPRKRQILFKQCFFNPISCF